MSLITRAIDKAYIKRAEKQIRAEHDAWMRTAQLHTPYYTVNPTILKRDDLPHTRDSHSEYVFIKRGAFGIPNQLITRCGTPSWEVWYHHGPLTLTPKPTEASLRAMDEAREAGALATMQAQVEAAALAELRRLYPESIKALVNA